MFNYKMIVQSDKLAELIEVNGITIGFDEDSGYLDFNLTEPDERFADVLDLVTYALSPNEKYFERHGNQAKDVISNRLLPAIIDCESDTIKVVEVIAEAVKKVA